MHRFKSVLSLLLALFCGSSLFGQIQKDRLNVTIEACLPSDHDNDPYRAYMAGVITFQPKLQYKFYKDFYVAGGLRYTYMGVAETRVPQHMIGGEHIYGGYIEAGWSSWQGERFGVELGIKAGYAHHTFVTDSTKVHGYTQLNAPYVMPQLSLILSADEAVAYRWIIGYNFDLYRFHPSMLGLTTNGGYDTHSMRKSTQSIVVGFAFTWYFGNERSEE